MKIFSAIAIFLVTLVCGFGGSLAWERLCVPSSGVTVSVNGKYTEIPIPQACPNGLILVTTPGEMSILIDKADNEILFTGTEFHNFLGVVFAHDPKPTGVSAGSIGKLGMDPEPHFGPSSISYTDPLSRDRIEVHFSE